MCRVLAGGASESLNCAGDRQLYEIVPVGDFPLYGCGRLSSIIPVVHLVDLYIAIFKSSLPYE